MSEDDTDALHQAVEEQLAAERDAFEACFPPEAFTGIAKALKVRPTPENLSWLRGRLLPDFYFCLDVRHLLKEPTRKQEINHLKKICEAATTLHSSLTSFHPLAEPLHWLGANIALLNVWALLKSAHQQRSIDWGRTNRSNSDTVPAIFKSGGFG